MKQQPPLRWRRHRLTTVPPDVAPTIVRHLAPAAALARAARGVAVEEGSIALPELPESPVEKAASLLRVAAEVEHALMVQYLYAGSSLTDSAAASKVTGVAVEEMSHLMTVQNLLRLIGQPPHLNRQDDDGTVDDEHRLFPFDFRLEPVSNVSLAKYVVAESPDTAPEGVDADVLARVVDLATGAQRDPVNRVGTLYALLSAVFATPELLHEHATVGGDVDADEARWYAMVEQFAAEAAAFYGGPEHLHLPDDAFDAAPVVAQGTDPDWDRSRTGTIDEFRVHPMTSRWEALEALRDIGLQGEGPSVAAGEPSHFRRFYDQFLSLFGPDGLGTVPAQGAVLPLPAGARIVVRPGGPDGDDVVSHPTTAQWAELADLRYALLLGCLERYLRAPADDRAFLRGWCFAEMYALRKLATLLRTMPAGSGTTPVAAVPFNPPVWPGEGPEWADLAAAFEKSVMIAGVLIAGVPEGDLDGAHQLLAHLIASDGRKLADSQARASAAPSPRTRTDAVRDALDWAAGAGDPGHNDSGRFWNLRHSEFVQVEIFGDNVTTRPPEGGDAPIVDQLRRGSMPRLRPSLDPATSPEFRLVETWVADGCPDDPV